MKLNAKITMLLLTVVSSVMTAYGIHSMISARKEFSVDAERSHKILLANATTVMAQGMWNLDTNILRSAVNPLFSDPSILSVALMDNEGKLFFGMERPPETAKEQALLELDPSSKKFADLSFIGKDKPPLKPYNVEAQKLIGDLITLGETNFRVAATLWYTEKDADKGNFLGHIIMDYNTDYVARRLAAQRNAVVVLSLVLGSSIIGLVYLFLNRSIVRPIISLEIASLDIASGKYTRVPLMKSNDEIAILSRNFNHMVDNVQLNTQNLSHLVEEGKRISSKVTLKQIEEQIKFSLKVIFGKDLPLNVVFHSKCFLTQDVAFQSGPHFFKLDETSNKPSPANAIPAEAFESVSCELVSVKDPRNGEIIAGFWVDPSAAEPGFFEKYASTLNALANSVSSAIGTVRLETSMQLLDAKTSEIRTIFSNISQGICSIDDAALIQPEYSSYLKNLLGFESLEGLSLFDVLFKNSSVNPDALSQVDCFIKGCMGEDIMMFEINENVLPNEIERHHLGHKQVLELDWVPLLNEMDCIERIMVTIRDVTALRKLHEAAEENRKEMQMIEQIVSVPVDRFTNFVGSAQKYLDACLRSLVSGETLSDAPLSELKRNLHTVKGNSRVFNFSELTDSLHTVETELQGVLVQSATIEQNNPARKTLHAEVGKSVHILEKYVAINRDKLQRGAGGFDERKMLLLKEASTLCSSIFGDDRKEINIDELKKLKHTLGRIESQSLDDILSPIVDSLPALASELGKETPEIKLTSDPFLFTQKAADILNGAFMHIVRNSCDHGIAAGSVGSIIISPSLSKTPDGKKFVSFIYEDTGRGLDLERLRNMGIEKGFLQPGASDTEAANMIFESGLSTATKVTTVSGRGVGMDAVKASFEELGGDCVIELGETTHEAGFRKFRLKLTAATNILHFYQDFQGNKDEKKAA